MQIEPKDARAFLQEIIRDANAGRSFVPFIGSGLPSPSGIIMGVEFTNYLAFTVFLVLCNPAQRERTHGEGRTVHWDLKRQVWPPLPSELECRDARKWIQAQFEHICARLELDINYGIDSAKSIK